MSLNRRQKRNQQRLEAKKENIYIVKEERLLDLTRQEVLKEREQMKKQVVYEAIKTVMGTVLLSMHDEFGIGKKRMQRFLDRFNNQYDCIQAGTVDIDDFNNWCMSKGIDLNVMEKGA